MDAMIRVINPGAVDAEDQLVVDELIERPWEGHWPDHAYQVPQWQTCR